MGKIKAFLNVLFVVLIVDSTQIRKDNAGREFILLFLKGIREGIPVQLSMTTPLENKVQVRVQTPKWQSNYSVDMTVNVEPGQLTLFSIPDQIRMKTFKKENMSILVTASDTIILFATSLQFATGDSFIVYPVESLGMEYVAVSYRTGTKKKSLLGCVAKHDNTIIVVYVPMNTSIDFEGKTYAASDKILINLNQYETFQLRGNDVTGSIISSDKIIACFSGANYIHVMCNLNTSGSDHLEEQLVPVSAWSYRYIVVSNPMYRIGAGDIVQIVIYYNQTFVSIQHSNSSACFKYELNRGMFQELFLKSGDAVVIQSDKPILVAQISCSQGISNSKGDARLLISPSEEHFLPNYTFLTPSVNLTKVHTHGIVIIAETDTRDHLILNEENISSRMVWSDIGNTKYSYGILALGIGVYNLYSHLGGIFGGYVYGYYKKSEFATVIGRDMSKTHARKVTAPTESSEKKTRSAMFEFVATDTMPGVTEMEKSSSASLVICFQNCIRYSNCIIVAYNRNGLCLLYGFDAKCYKLIYSAEYTLFEKR